MDVYPSVVTSVLAGIVALCVFASYLWPSKRNLAHIPTVGGSSLPILSYIGAVRYLLHAPDILEEGYAKYRGGFFKHASVTEKGWHVVVCSMKGIDEFRKAPEEYLSFYEATNESLQVEYTIGPAVMTNPYHIAIIRSNLTRAPRGLFPELRDEIIHSFKTVIPETDGAPIQPKLVS